MEPQYALFIALTEKYQPFLLALALVQTRMFGFMTLFPLFSWARIQGQTKTMFSLSMSFPLAVSLQDVVAPLMGNEKFALLTMLFIKEAIVGLGLGILLGIPFWGIQTAGDLIDSQRGSTQQNQTDPVNSQEVTTTGTILLLSGLTIFVIAGGLFAVIQLFYDSYKFWPVQRIDPLGDVDALFALGKTLTLIFSIGMIIGGPALILMFALDLVLAIGNKLAVGVEISEMSNSIKNVMVALMIPLYGMFLVRYVKSDWQTMIAFLRSYLGLQH